MQEKIMKVANRFFENVAKFKHLGTTVTNQYFIHGENKSRLNAGNTCCDSGQDNLISCLL
jgi:hypothetical protein